MSHRKDVPSGDAKRQTLQQQGALHPRPQQVRDPLFAHHEFFDPRDLVQVKYEMLRRVQLEGLSVTCAAQQFGFSRPAFYHAWESFQHRGLLGLVRDRPGPRQAHKLSTEVLAFLVHLHETTPTLSATALAAQVQQAFGLSLHPRSIERALKRQPKKRP